MNAVAESTRAKSATKSHGASIARGLTEPKILAARHVDAKMTSQDSELRIPTLPEKKLRRPLRERMHLQCAKVGTM